MVARLETAPCRLTKYFAPIGSRMPVGEQSEPIIEQSSPARAWNVNLDAPMRFSARFAVRLSPEPMRANGRPDLTPRKQVGSRSKFKSNAKLPKKSY